MEPSVTELVAETHRKAMRTIALFVGEHFEGDNQAAKVLQREKTISQAISPRLTASPPRTRLLDTLM